jgi:hypothetical protein
VFHTKDIESAIEKGKKYNPDVSNMHCRKSLGIDPSFGSSPFGLVVPNGLITTFRLHMQKSLKDQTLIK